MIRICITKSYEMSKSQSELIRFIAFQFVEGVNHLWQFSLFNIGVLSLSNFKEVKYPNCSLILYGS